MFHQPKTIREALGLKAELKEKGTFIAGGTDLVVLMNAGKAAPENFIDLSHIKELTAITKHNGTIELAATPRMRGAVNCREMPARVAERRRPRHS